MKDKYQMNIGAILLIIFVVLKLAGLIDWSWWWVLSPLWIPIAIFVMGLLLMATVAMIMVALGEEKVNLIFRKKNKNV